jgi:hypothetical protein
VAAAVVLTRLLEVLVVLVAVEMLAKHRHKQGIAERLTRAVVEVVLPIQAEH